MPKNKPIHITYIGRLEKEKGIELIIDCIKNGRETNQNIVWHICGDWSYMNLFRELEKYEKSDIRIYGRIDRPKINEILSQSDLVLMPSLFLETFGLVALETLMQWVPVCGFARGGLINFVHPSLTLDPSDPMGSFFQILDMGEFPLLDVSDFAYDIWIERLRDLTDGVDRILLVTDYTSIVGWAEQYAHDLSLALHSIGKEVEIYGYEWDVSRWMRLWLMLMTPFAYWRGIALDTKIQKYQPDLIWMHAVLRYIWPHGIRSVWWAHCRKHITHHDLGLITPYPSRIYRESDIPVSPWLWDWISHSHLNIFTIFAVVGKWLSSSWIWHYLNMSGVTHILPSAWMSSHFEKYSTTPPIVFPHTSQNNTPVNK